jgi:hypothetical protein
VTAAIAPLLEALPKARQVRPGAWVGCCPAHEDRDPSLSWTGGQDGRVLIRCHAGCTVESIVDALGEPMTSLFAPSENGAPTRLRMTKPEPGPVARTRRFEAVDTSGRTWTHTRHEDDAGRAVGAIRWEAGAKLGQLQPYGSELVETWPADDPLFLVEGEATADALRSHGLPALGTFGTSYRPDPAALARLRGRRLILWPDNDEAGRGHMLDMAERLAGIASAIRWIEPPAAAFCGWDAADADEATIRRLIASADAIPAGPSEIDVMGIDAADLLALDLPPLRWIVPDLIPQGTTIVASPPKVGKSCLIYQVATEVAVGGQLFGRRVASGSALYYALEDGQRRGQGRLRAALAGRTMPRGRLEVRWSAPKLGDGLEDDLRTWLDAHADAALVAIDTLGKVRKPTNGKRGAYEVDVEDLGRLQELFRDRDVALVVVHHARKAAGDDFLASVSGTYGITGSADTIVSVQRPRLEAFGSLLVTGRDVPDAKIPVRFDGLTWDAAPESLPEASFERQEVYQVIASRGPIFPAAIGKVIGKERQNVQNMVDALHKAGAIARGPGGYVAAQRAPISPMSPMSVGDIGDTRDTTRARDEADYPSSAWDTGA